MTPPMTPDEKHVNLGQVGEKLVRNYLASQGAMIIDSVNPYDREKDFIADGKRIEIKTQIPFVTQNAITFVPKQAKKLLNADRVFFVVVPSDQHHEYNGTILEIDMKKANIIDRQLRNGDLKHMIKLDDPAVTMVHRITDQKELNLLTGYSTSDFKLVRS